MTALSPAAQAVMVAATRGNPNVINDPVYRQCVASAIQAAADHIDHDWSAFNCVDALYEIAAELKRLDGCPTLEQLLDRFNSSHLGTAHGIANVLCLIADNCIDPATWGDPYPCEMIRRETLINLAKWYRPTYVNAEQVA